MTSSANNRITAFTDPASRLVNADNLIRGGGSIGTGVMRLTNHGVIRADTSLAELLIAPRGGTDGVINTGLLEAADNGTLRLQSGNYTNEGGLVRAAANSTVRLESAIVVGGTVEVAAMGALRTITNDTVSRLDDLLLQVNPGGLVSITNRTELRLGSGGTYLVGGTLAIPATGNVTTLRLSGPEVVLGGGGELVLADNANARIIGDASVTTLVNADLDIRGGGQIGQGTMGIVNHGSIHADGAAAMVIGPNSTLGFANHGVLRASGLGGLQIQSGPFQTTGDLLIAAPSKITRVGNLSMTAGTAVVDGQLQITNGSLQIVGGELSGNGTVTGSAVNLGGVVRPGADASGTLVMTGSYAQQADGELSILFEGGGASKLQVSGVATIAGTLRVDGRSGVSGSGESFVILTAASIAGQFDQVFSSDAIRVIYDTTANEVRVAFVESCRLGDLNCDGVVDGADLGAMLAQWGPCEVGDGVICSGDLNGNGLVDGADLGLLLSNWGTGGKRP